MLIKSSTCFPALLLLCSSAISTAANSNNSCASSSPQVQLILRPKLTQTATLSAPGAQQTPPEADVEKRKAQIEKALTLLDETAKEATSLRLMENRVYAQTLAANLLWQHDEPRARALYSEAIETLRAAISSLEMSSQEANNRLHWLNNLRHQMLQTIAQRDPKMALDFLRSTRLPTPPVLHFEEYRQPDPEAMLELQLANHIALSDPQQALRIAEESLRGGVSSNVIGVLGQLQAKDSEAATKLAGSVIKRLRSSNFGTEYEAVNVASQLLRMTQPGENPSATPANAPAAGPVGVNVQIFNRTMSNRYGNRGSLKVDEGMRRELIETVVAATLNIPSNRANNAQELFRTLQTMLPEVERVAPQATVTNLRRRATEVEQVSDPQSKMWQQYQEVIESGSVERLLDEAQKAPAQMRVTLYQRAAFKALEGGSAEQAKQIITNNISDPAQRASMLKDFERQAAYRAAQEGRINEARQIMQRAGGSPDEHIQLLLHLATTAAAAPGQGDKKVAGNLLDEAYQLLQQGKAENHQQLNSQLQLARLYAVTDQANQNRGFDLVEAVATRLNELIAAAAVLNGFHGGQDFSEGELRAVAGGGSMWSGIIEQCGNTLGALAHADFDRARALANRFDRLEARTLARLSIAQNLLGENQPQRGMFRRSRMRH